MVRPVPRNPRFWIVAIAACAAVSLGPTSASGEAAILVDADSGRVLYTENATHPWYPASVTKIMTAYVILKAVKEGRISLDKPVAVSDNAVAQQPTKMGFAKGTLVTVDNALKMLMVKSANDMAVLLAEGLSGSIENFATEMNRAAQRLGMTQSTYVNPNGLPADGQVTSARDLALLARAVIRDLPEYELYFRIPAIRFGKRVIRNYNTLIDRYPGADGMKTGFICASGFNLVATATRGSRRLIAVVLGSRSGLQRAEKAAQLLERGFTGGGGLSWLIPTLGTVDALQPVNAEPPNLRDEICGKGRRSRPPSDSEEEPVTVAGSESGSVLATMAAFQLGPRPQGSLLGPLTTSMAPIPVYAGLPKQPAGMELASGPPTKKKKRAATPQTAAAPSGQTAAANGQLGAPILPSSSFQRAGTPDRSSTTAARKTSDKPSGKPSVKPAASADSASSGAKAKAKPKPKPVAAKQ
jgi:D-alanyl-D-alanine carboxypeptidase